MVEEAWFKNRLGSPSQGIGPIQGSVMEWYLVGFANKAANPKLMPGRTHIGLAAATKAAPLFQPPPPRPTSLALRSVKCKGEVTQPRPHCGCERSILKNTA